MLQIKPNAVAMISGLRISSKRNPVFDCLTIGQTAAIFSKGTQTPTKTAISKTPLGPARRSAIPRAIKVLKRNATWAQAACWRGWILCFKTGQYGKL